MPKKGPGRPMKLRPGPKLNISSSVTSLSHREFENTILREVLEDSEFSFFTQLPTNIKDSYIKTLKNSLFNIAGKAEASQAINYSEAEYQDLSGVQVNLSLNPADWKDPDKYLKATVQRWANSLLNYDDLEREFEKQIVLDLMKGKNGTKSLTDTKLLADHTFVTGQKIDGATGNGGRYDYKDFATQVLNFVDDSQAIDLRANGLLQTKAKFYELLGKEFYKNSPKAVVKAWMDVETAKTPKNVAIDNDSMGQNFINAINDLPAGHTRDKLEKLFIESLSDAEFKKIFSGKSISKIGPKYTLLDIASGASAGNPKNHFSQDNYVSRLKFLDTMIFTLDDVFIKDIAVYSVKNWKQLGFTSQIAAQKVMGVISNKDITTSINAVVVPGLFSPADRFQLRDSKDFTPQDLVAVRNLFENVLDNAKDAKEALVGAMEKNFKFHEKEYMDAIADTITDPAARKQFLDNSVSISKWKQYVDVRSTALTYEEFIGYARDRKLLNTYFFLGKYNDMLPPQIQDIKKKIDNISLPLNRFGVRKVGDVQQIASSFRDYTAYKLGLASNPKSFGYYTDGPFLNPLVRAFKNHAYMYQSDFVANAQYAGGINSFYNRGTNVLENVAHPDKVGFTLFPGTTYDSLKTKASGFKKSGLFSNYDPGVLLLFADDLAGLPTAFEGMERMIDFIQFSGGGVDQMSVDFETWFNLWKSTGNTDFFDGLANRLSRGLTPVTPEEMVAYKTAFGSLFKSLDGFKSKNDVDPKDFFSFCFTAATDKGFIKSGLTNGVKDTYLTYKYMPVLNGISSHLNQLQTYIIRFTENKVLKNTIFKFVPGTQDLWNIMVKPGVGAYDFVQDKLKPFLQKISSKLHINVAFKRLVDGPMGTFLKSFLGKILPSFITATSLATFGTSFLVYAVARYGKAMVASFLAVIKGNFKAVYYEFLNATKDIFVVPVQYIGKILLYILLAFLGIILILLLLIVPSLLNQERPLSVSTEFEDQLIPLELRDGKYCISEAFGGKGYEVLQGKLGFPVSGSTSYDAGQCPGYSPTYGSAHMGVDIAVVAGTSVRTPFINDSQCWKVEKMSSGWSGGYGNLVVISAEVSGKTFYFYFAHNKSLNNSLTVGDTYCEPKVLANSDSTGNSTGNHVHFEIRSGDGTFNNVVNPCSVMACPSGCFSDDFSKACQEVK